MVITLAAKRNQGSLSSAVGFMGVEKEVCSGRASVVTRLQNRSGYPEL